MSIIKSLPWRKVESNEALGYYLRNAPISELVDLKRQRTWRAMRFRETFQATGFLRVLSGKPNKYEQASRGLAGEMQQIGRAACMQGCSLCVHAQQGSNEEVPTSVYLKVQCDEDGCPEDGLLAVDTALAKMPDSAENVIIEFNNTPLEVLTQSEII